MPSVAKGKKRARESPPQEVDVKSEDSDLSPLPEEDEHKQKKQKKAITRPCPICNENIPIRLLGKHADLEMQRVEEIMRNVDISLVQDDGAGPSTGRRGAAVKARMSMATLGPRTLANQTILDQVEKTVKVLQRNRKQRHAKLKEMMMQDSDEALPKYRSRNGTTCPVCMVVVEGDDDVIESHVDACVANASIQAETESQRWNSGADAWGEYEVDGEIRIGLRNSRNLRGTGFHVRDNSQQDIEDDVDVDGDDGFGDAQFTERDILQTTVDGPAQNRTASLRPDEDDNDEGGAPLRELISQGKVTTRTIRDSDMENAKVEMEEIMGVGDADRAEENIRKAKLSGDEKALVSALEEKIQLLESMRVSSSTSSLCRICLDPYNEPTVSTGCWHTCCRECWLRCLGSTKLCPICKRITAATDLRRIYM